ncbi:MAG: hypothetical protein ABR507_06055 [Actinomycetota bacterium]|nr:hypothetical protein [Actinomycetota bacterium]
MPRTFPAAAILLGVIWVVQGFGLLKTGSFMDHKPMWGWFGLIAIVAGLAAILISKRKP